MPNPGTAIFTKHAGREGGDGGEGDGETSEHSAVRLRYTPSQCALAAD